MLTTSHRLDIEDYVLISEPDPVIKQSSFSKHIYSNPKHPHGAVRSKFLLKLSLADSLIFTSAKLGSNISILKSLARSNPSQFLTIFDGLATVY
jgi:hypothetical protein